MIWKLLPRFKKRKNGTSYELLEAVIQAIKEEPRRVDMVNWVKDLALSQSYDKPAPRMQPACGTQGCIAGWMHTMTAPTLKFVAAGAKHVLGKDAEDFAYSLLPAELSNDAHNLFHGGVRYFGDGEARRPYPFPLPSLGTMKDQRRYAREVIANIKKFMQLHEVELKAHKINIKEVYS